MRRVQVNASSYGTPGEVVAVEDGMVVWAGPIDALDEAGSFDPLFCHVDDEGRVHHVGAGVKFIPENDGDGFLPR